MNDENKNSVDLVIENLISIFPLLTKSFKKSIRDKTNHTPGSLFALGALSHHQILSMSELGGHLLIPKPNVTSLIDKLIAENFVERLYDSNDRRIIKIRITEKGIEEFNSVKLEITQRFRQKLQSLEADKLNTLTEASSLVRNILTWILIDQQPS
jgi:DNA-binding MarR family transcriptional regulator